MRSRVGFLIGTNAALLSREHTSQERLRLVVGNTGNIFFEEAIKRQLVNVDLLYSWEEISGYETIVLSMANFLSPYTDFRFESQMIERSGVEKVIMIGAGAQADNYGDKVILKPGTERFIRLISERSMAIGVRGLFTAEILNGMGIKNVEVIGCPSAFWGVTTRPSVVRKDILACPCPKVSINSTLTGKYRDSIANLLSFGLRYNADYVAQTERRVIDFASGMHSRDEIMFEAEYYNNGDYSSQKIRDWLVGSARCFFAIEEWLEYAASRDFFVGSRFHGCMAAIQKGIPALMLVFDSRTRELCEHLNIPFIFLKDFGASEELVQLYEAVDFELFNATIGMKERRYIDFLERNGLEHSFAISNNIGGNQYAAGEVIGNTQYDKIKSMSVAALLQDVYDLRLSANLLHREIMRRITDERPKCIGDFVEAGKNEYASFNRGGVSDRVAALQVALRLCEANVRD